MGGARRPCPRGARSTVQWIGTTLGRLQRCRPTSRARRRTRGAGVCPPRPSPPAAAGPTRHGQARLHVLPCLHKARRRHGAHRRHGALGARRPSSAALRVNDPRTVSKVVCPRPPRTSRCCSAVPVSVELNHVRLPLAAAWKDVGGPMSKYGPQNSWLFCSLNNIPDGVTACADLVLQTT